MNAPDLQFWDKKAATYGHTGNADPFVYCFDQAARIFVINSILQKKNVKKAQVLDFGCGSGDFIPYLLESKNNVSAYDISGVIREKVRTRFGSAINLLNTKQEIEQLSPFNNILTVTVLQHLPHNDLNQCLALFKKCLAKGGEMICLEFFPLQPMELQPYVSVDEWLSLLHKQGLMVNEVLQIYNPVEYPVTSWRKYQKNPVVNLLKPIKKFPLVQSMLRSIAGHLIQKHKDLFCDASGPYRVYIITHK